MMEETPEEGVCSHTTTQRTEENAWTLLILVFQQL